VENLWITVSTRKTTVNDKEKSPSVNLPLNAKTFALATLLFTLITGGTETLSRFFPETGAHDQLKASQVESIIEHTIRDHSTARYDITILDEIEHLRRDVRLLQSIQDSTNWAHQRGFKDLYVRLVTLQQTLDTMQGL